MYYTVIFLCEFSLFSSLFKIKNGAMEKKKKIVYRRYMFTISYQRAQSEFVTHSHTQTTWWGWRGGGAGGRG